MNPLSCFISDVVWAKWRSLCGMRADSNFLRYQLHQYTGGRVAGPARRTPGTSLRATKAYADGRQKASAR